MYHVKKDKFGKTKLCNIVYISNTTRLFSSEEWRKIRNNPGVLKMIQGCSGRNKKAVDHKMRKCGNINGTINTLNMNTEISQTDIAPFHTFHPNENIIPAEVQMPHMGSQRVVHSVATNNDVSGTGLVISKRFSI